MYGIVMPASVVVVARSAGSGCAGLKGLKQPLAGGAAGGLGSGRTAAQPRRGRSIVKLELGRDIALGVEGEGAEAARVGCRRAAARRHRHRRCAHEGKNLRAGEDRAADGMVRDREACGVGSGRVGGNDVRADREAGNQAGDAAIGSTGECARHIAVTDRNLQALERPVIRQDYLDEGIASAHQVRPIGKGHDLQRSWPNLRDRFSDAGRRDGCGNDKERRQTAPLSHIGLLAAQ
jgi:hypothetical protein